jgi:hypothetical protein
MTYLYIDESGDLGFNPKGSKYFILTCLKINNEQNNNKLLRITKKIRQSELSKKQKKQSELKFSNSTKFIRKCFFDKFNKLNTEIYYLIIEKEHTNMPLQENLPILYNYLINILLETPLINVDKDSNLVIYLDKCMSKKQIGEFENYFKTKFLTLFKQLPNLKLFHESSNNNNGLQAVDFVCGACGYKYNTCNLSGDCNYYMNMIKDKIFVERTDFF